MLTRRAFLQTTRRSPDARTASGPKRIAIVTTVYRYLSHGQHIGDRFLVGYPYAGAWHKPNVKVVSLYVDQKPEGDLSGERAREFGFPVYPTIAETLRCGGGQAGRRCGPDHRGAWRLPDETRKGRSCTRDSSSSKHCTDVFEQDGRAVPVYNDKHLSYSFEKAQAMVAASKRLRFPMLAGSSLPVTWRLPELELPLGCHIDDALMVGVGGSDAMDYHALEGYAVHGGAAWARRNGRARGSNDRRRRRMEGRRGRPVV